MPTKIEKYAHEPCSFYLHKHRRFLRKLDKQDEEDRQEEAEALLEQQDRERNFILIDEAAWAGEDGEEADADDYARTVS